VQSIAETLHDEGLDIVTSFEARGHDVGEVGIDYVFCDDELYVLEVNTLLGSKGLRTMRSWKPSDARYIRSGVVQLDDYDNDIRDEWGEIYHQFLSNPLFYAEHVAKGKKE
jgi:hypothetical protein